MHGDDDSPRDGRSRERERQDGVLDREARRESWLARLFRQRTGEKGRPAPRKEGTLDRGDDR
jgi:hypothetical protein